MTSIWHMYKATATYGVSHTEKAMTPAPSRPHVTRQDLKRMQNTVQKPTAEQEDESHMGSLFDRQQRDRL